MAFVFRDQKGLYTTSTTPGPGQYPKQHVTRQQKLLTAPFNQTSPRKIWEENTIPGPGSYSIYTSTEHTKTFIQNCGQNFALYQAPMETSIFKSSSKRFKDIDHKNPGPGQYKTEIQKTHKERRINLTSSLQKYLQKSGKNDRKEEGLLGMILQKKDQEQDKKQNTKPEKKLVPFNSQVERGTKVRPQTSIGPGSYEIAKSQQTKQQKRKPSCHSIIKIKKNIDSQEMIPPRQERILTQQTKETITKKSFNQRKEDFFGSTVARFKRLQKTNQPGPGNYDLPVKSHSSKTLKKKLAFGRSSMPNNRSVRHIFVSPFCYQTSNMEELHQTHEKKISNKSFGSKQPRFKELKIVNDCLQPSISNQRLELFLGIQSEKATTNLKKIIYKSPKLKVASNSKSSHIIKNNKLDRRPLCYGPQVNTIAGKIKQKIQINAPFLTHATRFTENDYDEPIIEEITMNKQKSMFDSSQKNKNGKPCIGIMTSKNPRFVYKEETEHLSPCSYDPSFPPTKKQFNRLFL